MTEQQRQQPAGSAVRSDGRASPAAGARAMTRRPGILTFAAVMMFVVAGFSALMAITEFAGTGWWVTASGDLVYANLIFWAVVDTIITAIALYAGADLLRGGAFGMVMGYVFAGVGLIRWLFFIPVAPVLAVAVVVLCAMVIYGLASHSDYFHQAA